MSHHGCRGLFGRVFLDRITIRQVHQKGRTPHVIKHQFISSAKLATLGAAILILSAGAAFAAFPVVEVPPELPAIQPGPARPWHAEVQVSTYSSVNTFNGNMFTAIPIVSWSGVGPDMNMMLYHNSANWNQTAADTKNVGFFLGPGWSTSYSDRLLLTYPYVWVHADGTRDEFTWSGNKLVGPPGTYEELERDSGDPNIWRVRHKNQSYHEFQKGTDNVVRLTRIVDATGKALTLQYSTATPTIPIRLQSIVVEGIPAERRPLQFEYDAANQLTRIFDPRDETTNPVDGDITNRYWTFTYTTGADGNPWMTALTDVMGYRIDFDYELKPCSIVVVSSLQINGLESDSLQSSAAPGGSGCPEYDFVGRLISVSNLYDPDDPNDPSDPYETPSVFRHTYYPSGLAAGKADQTTDPVGVLSQPQRFAYTAWSPGYITTTYYDRRGSAWKYGFNSSWQNLYPDGNLNWIEDPMFVSYGFYYDTNRNLTDIIDNNGADWFRQFDAKGNMTYAVDPLGHFQSWTYDVFNNVTSRTDAVGNITRFYYDHATDPTPYPTLLTRIVEPGPLGNPPLNGQGDFPVTRMEYYLDQSSKHGQLSRVTDPKGVITEFDYDKWGQRSGYGEGLIGSQTASSVFDPGNYVYAQVSENDSAGNTTYSDSSGGSGGSSSHDNHGNSTSSKCMFAITQQSAASMPPGFPAVTCSPPVSGGSYTEFSSATYSARDELLNLPLEIHANGSATRTHSAQYDALGRRKVSATTSNESGYTVTRPFGFDYDLKLGQYTRHGPDGMDTFVQMNTANRIEFMHRGFPGQTQILAAFYYYNNLGLLTSVVYGNLASTTYQYDVVHRLTQIRQLDASGSVPQAPLQMDYTYTADDLPWTITESGTLSGSATVTFTYDNRRRLIREVRTGATPYDLTYEYDDGGNRTKKIDNLGRSEIRYHYDLENPATYGSKNNRLMFYKEFDTTQPGAPGDPGALRACPVNS